MDHSMSHFTDLARDAFSPHPLVPLQPGPQIVVAVYPVLVGRPRPEVVGHAWSCNSCRVRRCFEVIKLRGQDTDALCMADAHAHLAEHTYRPHGATVQRVDPITNPNKG